MRFFYLIIIFVVLLSIESCINDSPDCSPINLPLNYDDLLFIPYSQFSKVTFFDSQKNDTIVFDCIRVDTSHTIDYVNPEGCEKIIILGKKVWRFSSIYSSDTISLVLESSYNKPRKILVGIGSQEFGFYNSGPTIQGNDQIIILGNTYDTIIKFQNFVHPKFSTNHFCYYNMKNGILKIEKDSGNLELVRLIK
jgi:hypothetical protein